MPSFRTGTVTAITAERTALQRVEVDGEAAYVLTELIGSVAVGDQVVINTTAVDLGLGTGGAHVVHWNLSRTEWSMPGEGHQLKLRYTSLQTDTGAAEDVIPDDGPGPTGRPVVACALHSQAAVVAVVARSLRPDARIAYVMTDAGALPIAMSELVADLRKAGVLDVTITAGQAFGGDLEAVNTISAIDIAARTGADIIIAGMGPGSLGTDSTLGYSGLEVGSILDGAAALGHLPIAAVRYSGADARARHQGVSHHTHTALTRFTRAPVTVPIPRGAARPDLGHHLVLEVDIPDVPALLAARGLEVTTMGRDPDEDPEFYRYAAAAGVAAGTPEAIDADPDAATQAVPMTGDGGVTAPVAPPEPVYDPAAWAPVTGAPAAADVIDEAPADAKAQAEDVAVDDPEVAEEPVDQWPVEPEAPNDLPYAPPDEPDEEAAPAEPRDRTVRNIVEWVGIVVAALLAAFVIKTFLFQAFYIPSASMDPTLHIGDRVLVNKMSYRLHDVRRGDVIVFERPPGNTAEPEIKDLIKRVIALPGDTIESRDGEVYVNGRRLNEPYLDDSVMTTGIDRQKVPDDRYWVMGDNRTESRDSRVFSSIPEKSIIGRAFVRVWPVGHLGLL